MLVVGAAGFLPLEVAATAAGEEADIPWEDLACFMDEATGGVAENEAKPCLPLNREAAGEVAVGVSEDTLVTTIDLGPGLE